MDLALLWEWIGFLGFLCLMVSFLDHNSQGSRGAENGEV